MNRSLRGFKLLVASLAVPGITLATVSALPGLAQQNQPVSDVRTVKLAQANQVDLSELKSHLQAQDWQAADAETRRILQTYVHPNGDIFGSPLPTLIPPEVLQTIDQLWVEASDGRFGFNPQLEIWETVRAENPADSTVAAKAFGERVGWTRPTPDPDNFVSPDWLTEPELTYSLDAPVGHLPWAGIDWSRIEAMLTAQSCGSCMVDAMYLQGERFGQYLPVLFNWVATALPLPIPADGSWEQPYLAQTINVEALYPNNNCPVYKPEAAISPDGSIIAVSSYSYERSCSNPNNSTLALWNAQTGTRRITLLRGQAVESFSYSGRPQEPETEGTRMVGDVANAIAFTPDSRLIVAGLSNGTIQLWTTDKGEAVRTLSGHRYAVRAIALSPDGRTLASASSDNTIKLWNLQTRQLIRTISLNAAEGIVHTLQISPDGQRLATATNRNTLQLWNAQTGQLVRTLVNENIHQHPYLPIAFSPDGQTVATGDSDHSVKLWNASTGARIITLRGHNEMVQHLAFSPGGEASGQRLATSDSKTARLWNLQTYQTVRTLELIQSAGHPTMPNNLAYVAFSPDGHTLAASSLLLPLVESEPIPRQGITLWNVETGRSIAQIHDVAQFQFSPDGEFLMARGRQVEIWEPYRRIGE
jgi:WD40 repeat protein